MEIRNIPPPTYRTEIRELLALCFPIIASSLLLFALNIEDQLIVGHLLTKEDLAAVALANTFFNLFWYVLVGLMSAIDTFGAQAYGAKQYKQVGVWAQRGLFICLVASIPMVLILVTSTQWIVLHVFNQEPNVAAKTALFINFLMPGLPFLIVADVLRRWLQVQGHLSPAVYTGVIVNLLNIGLNFLFIHWFGLKGSPLATSFSRILQVVFLLMIIKYRKLNYKTISSSDSSSISPSESNSTISTISTMPKWNWDVILQKAPLKSFLTVAMPGAAMLLLEAGAFETSTLIVGSLGNIDILDAHFVMLSLCGFSFVAFPLSVSIAASIRVGWLLGQEKPKHAQMSGWLSVFLGVSFMTFNGILFASCRNYLGYIFTTNIVIIELVSKIAMIAALFQIVDGVQGTVAGVLRGCGRQKYVALTNLLGFWLLGVPIGLLLAFPGGLGVYGVWWGLFIGLTVASTASVWILYNVDWINESKLALKRVTRSDGSGSRSNSSDSKMSSIAIALVGNDNNDVALLSAMDAEIEVA